MRAEEVHEQVRKLTLSHEIQLCNEPTLSGKHTDAVMQSPADIWRNLSGDRHHRGTD